MNPASSAPPPFAWVIFIVFGGLIAAYFYLMMAKPDQWLEWFFNKPYRAWGLKIVIFDMARFKKVTRIYAAIPVVVALVALLVACSAIMARAEEKHSYMPEDGYVPDAETAVRIAEAVWRPIYGNSIEGRRPFRAELAGDIWSVQGSLPEGMLGGVPEADIRKKDGTILRVSHGK